MPAIDQKQLITLLAIGMAGGWLASWLVGGSRWGLIGSLLSGIVGLFVGGQVLKVANINLGIGNEWLERIATSTIGAVVVVIVARIIG
jgi:uncharacterized membrane protein YeaQ/YmgE (transglycosylase-associated protein family)